MQSKNIYWEQSMFFFPLAVTGFLLAFTGTIVNAGLARLANPVLMISSFAVARTFMQFLISPLHMVRPTVTALSLNEQDFGVVKKFSKSLVVLVSFLVGVFAFTGLSSFVFSNLMNLSPEISATATAILKLLVFYPTGLFLKDFYHGVLILFKKTSLITAGTTIRILVVTILAFTLHKISFLPGTFLAGGILLCAAFSEGIPAMLFSRLSIGNISQKIKTLKLENPDSTGLDVKKILSFYWPLMLTTYLKTLTQPLINSGLGRTSNPEETIAIFALSFGTMMSFISPLNMFHQVSLRFSMEEGKNRSKEVFRFGIILGGIICFILFILSFTPLGILFFREIIRIDEEMSLKAAEVLKYALPLPFITVLREYYWGILLKKRSTIMLGLGKIVHLFFLTLSFFLLFTFGFQHSAAIGFLSILSGEFFELIFIRFFYSRRQSNASV